MMLWRGTPSDIRHRRWQSILYGFACIWSRVPRPEEERVLENSLVLTWSPAYGSWHSYTVGWSVRPVFILLLLPNVNLPYHYLGVAYSSRSIASAWLSISLPYVLFHVPTQVLLHHQFTVLHLTPCLHYGLVPQESGMSCPSQYNQGVLANWSSVSTHTRLFSSTLIQVLVWCMSLKTLSILDSQ